MPETPQETVNRLLREHKRYTDDGLPNEPTGAPLPVGDPASGPWNPKKVHLREALLAPITAAAQSASEAAEEADRAEQEADRAESEADRAATNAMSVVDRAWFKTVADLLADNNSVIGYATSGADFEVAAGDIITAQGFRYEVAASDAVDAHVETAGGLMLYVLPGVAGYNMLAFGATGDGTTVDRDAVQKFFDVVKDNGRGIVPTPSVAYNLGVIASGERWAVHVDSPENMVVEANFSLFTATTSEVRVSAIAIKNPLNVKINDIHFTQPGFDIADTIGGGANRIGFYGIALYATSPYSQSNPCGNVKITGDATDCIGFVVATIESGVLGAGTGAVAKAINNITVNGSATRVYYGVSAVSHGEGLEVNLNCEDVRRGLICFEQHRAKANLSLKCTSGFGGSNAFVSIICQGETYGNVKDIDVTVRASGVEAHEGLVTFYHQLDEAGGSIDNVRARVYCTDLTTVGKEASLGDLNVFQFFHTLENDTNLTPTTRAIENMDIDCQIVGTISGAAYKFFSVPDTKRNAYVGAGVFENAPVSANKQMMLGFKVLRGRQEFDFTPIVYGATTAGAATYSIQRGRATVIDGFCYVAIELAWTGHTGTGNIRVGVLPIPARSTGDGAPTIKVSVAGAGSSNFASNMFGLISGNNATITPYTVSSGAASQIAIPESGTLYISCSYPIY